MKILILSILIAALLFVFTGCSDDRGVPIPDNVIAGITVDSVLPNSSCAANDSCYYRVFAHFVEPDQGTYFYRLRLNYDVLKFTGEPFYRSNPNTDGMLVTCTLTVPYYSELAAQSYFFTIYKFGSLDDAYRMQNHVSPTRSDSTVFVYNFSSGCKSKTCTNENLEHARWYSRGLKIEDDITGVQAEIETWLTAKMCGRNSTCTTHTASNVHINVGDTTTGYWAQTGIISYRPSSQTNTRHEMFLEVLGSGGRQYQWFNAPADGDLVHYRLELNSVAGTWNLYVDQHPDVADYVTDAGWVDRSGNYVSFAAEISHFETDMMGLESDPCEISDCQYKVGSSYGYIQLGSSNIGTSDISEWGVSLGSLGNEVRFWDKRPQP